MMISKQDVMKAAGLLQVRCGEQEAVAEAALHAVHNIFKDHSTEAVLLIDAESALNAVNMKAMLYNFSIMCPIISTYISNCYNTQTCLLIIGETNFIKERNHTRQSNSDGSLFLNSLCR